MKITVNGVTIDSGKPDLELTVTDIMPGALIALVLREAVPAPLLVLTNPPTQNAESLDSNPVPVSWPLHNTTGGAQITGGVEPYVVTYTPTRGSSFAVGVTQVIIGVTSADNQTRQGFFNVDVTENVSPPYGPLDVTGPASVTAFSPNGSPVAVTFQPLATGGLQPYTFHCFEGVTERFSGNSFAVGTHTIDVEASDSEAPPNTDNTHSFPITVFETGTSHDYFDGLVTLPSVLRSYSLRNQTQLNNLTNLGVSNSFKYNVATDPYSLKQDAAKLLIPYSPSGSGGIAGNQQLKMPININSGSLLITWDFWYGHEFRHNAKPGMNQKSFQVRSNGGIWWTHSDNFARATGGPSNVVSKVYASLNPGAAGSSVPASVTDREPPEPPGVGGLSGFQFTPFENTWTRFWIDLQLNVPAADARWNSWKSQNAQCAALTGTWHMLTMWIADKNRNPVRLIYGVPWVVRPNGISSFDFEFASSCDVQCMSGDLIGYGRNVVILHNYSSVIVPDNDTTIFQKPV